MKKKDSLLKKPKNREDNMCCEDCPKYDKCEEYDKLKEKCCKQCPQYDDCVGTEYDEKYF